MIYTECKVTIKKHEMLDPGSALTESPYGYSNVNNNATYIKNINKR